MLEQIRHSKFDEYANLNIERITQMGEQSWQAETEEGEYVAIRFQDSCLQMSKSERLYDLAEEFNTVGLDKDFAVNLLKNISSKESAPTGKVSVGEIMTFMGWRAIPDQVWECNNF